MKKKVIAVILLILMMTTVFFGCKSKEPSDPAFNDESVSDDTSESAQDVETTVLPADAKVIYLTFDDGPGPYTQHLLAILAKYNVKATFFVTNFREDLQYLLAREANEGHTVAVHSYTHDYKKIYASTDAFWADYNQMDANIYQYTGKHATVMRFPGGSSNTVSKSYCEGIMTVLTKQALEKGLSYVDWNIDSNDSGSAKNSQAVCENMKKGVQYFTNSVILCHDVKKYTVEAMETFIPWALEEGYYFLPCTTESEPARHTVRN